MTLSISSATVLSNKTAAASTSTALSECTSIAGSALVALGIWVRLTYGSGATLPTAGAVVQVYASPDDDPGHWSSWPVQEVDVPIPAAGGPCGIAFTVLPGHAFYKVRVKNLDAAQAITEIYVYSEPQVLS